MGIRRESFGVAMFVMSALALVAVGGCGGLVVDDDGTGGPGEGPGDGPGDGSCSVLTSDEVDGGAELDAGCYEAEGKLTVNDGTLVLQPGTTLVFPEDSGIRINDSGRLNAEGTEEDPITFTGADETRAFWQGVRFEDSNSEDNVFRHVVVEYGGSSKWHGGDESRAGIYLNKESQLTMENVTIRESGQAGLVSTSTSTFELSNSTFASNDLPIAVRPGNVGSIESSNTFEGNDTSRIVIGAEAYWEGGGNREVANEATWRAHDIPYLVARTLHVEALVTIEPGAEFQFQQEIGLEVQAGGFEADASGGDQIVFTGEQGVPGYWRGLRFSVLSENNVLNNTVVEYGGSGNWAGSDSNGNVYVDEASLEIVDTTIRGSGGYGIATNDEVQISGCSGIMFEENQGDPLYIDDPDNSGCLSE